MPGHSVHVRFGVASTDPICPKHLAAKKKKPVPGADPHRFPPFYGNRSDFPLNFIRLLRVVITASVAERRKRLEVRAKYDEVRAPLKTPSWEASEIRASQICHNKYIFNNNKKTLQVKIER